MCKLNITKGNWEYSTAHKHGVGSEIESISVSAKDKVDENGVQKGVIVHMTTEPFVNIQEEIDNAKLFTDAANTYHRTGLLPSELASRLGL